MSKVVVALFLTAAAAAVGASAGLILSKPAPKVQARQVQQPAPQQAVAPCTQTLPPVTGALPHYSLDKDPVTGYPIPLSYPCQQEYVRQLNALNLTPSPVVWSQNTGRWGYYAPDHHFELICYTEAPYRSPLPTPLPADWFTSHFYGQ